jgi:1,3-beta-galactosyl-N-acetylhexosamine phosphorylase
VSLWDVEETGIPENAKVLFCYGLPNTGQNGGSWWAEPKIANAVKEFVNRGGGIVGLQAPSAHGEDGREWPLAEVFGLAPKDAQFFRPSGQKAIVGDESDPEEPVREATETTLTPAGRGGPWAAARRDPIPGFSLDVKTAAGNRDEVLYTAQGAPGVVAREHGQGRSVWIAGVSAAPEYRRLIRNAIFWAARREAESARVEITRGDDVSVYAYPKPRIIAVHNASGRAVSATCHVDAAIVGGGGRLRDLVTNEQVNPRDGSFSIRMPSRCTRLLRAD